MRPLPFLKLTSIASLFFLGGCAELTQTLQALNQGLQQYKTQQSQPSTTSAIQNKQAQAVTPTPQAFYQAAPVQPSVDPYAERAKNVSAAINPRNPVTRDFAIQLASKYPGNYNIGQVCAIHQYLYKNWKYVNDPRGGDYFASADETIRTGLIGDCDDFAIVMASLIEAIGGTARVIIAHDNTQTGHAYAEVFVAKDKAVADSVIARIPSIMASYPQTGAYLIDFINRISQQNAPQNLNYHYDQNGVWLNLDWQAGYPGGPYYNSTKATAIYPDGRYERIQ